MNLLVTGGMGFIGANFIHYWLKNHSDDQVVNVDCLTYAAVKENISDVKNSKNYAFENADIADFSAIDMIVKKHNIEVIVNFAAESHNSNSIISPTSFYHTNIMGTQNLLEIARLNKSIKRFHHVSTCEVYGDMALDDEGAFTENSPLSGNSPYSSSKACSNLVVNAYFKTFDIPATISICSNNYGPYQFPEKLIPVFITNIIQGKPLTLYKESDFKREWLNVHDHCRAIELILDKGVIGQTYNIGSGVEKSIEDISNAILDYFKGSEKDKIYVTSRPSHDRRYLLNSSKIRNTLGWNPQTDFEEGIIETIKWYVGNEQWWRPLLERRMAEENKWR